MTILRSIALQQEIETYERELPHLLVRDQGKWALVKEDRVIGVFDTYRDALAVGYDKFGLADFMVRKIEPPDHVRYFTRDIKPWRS